METQTYSNIQEDILHNYSLITNKNIKEERKEELLKEQFLKYLDSTREQLVIISSKYDDNFLNDLINSIIADRTKIKIGNDYIEIRDILTKYYTKEELINNYFLPYIKTYKHMSDRINILYKEEYEINGLKGIEYITSLLKEILANSQSAYNMPKEDITYQTNLIKKMMAFKYNIYTNSEEITDLKDYNKGIEKGFINKQQSLEKSLEHYKLIK